eukprot:8194593-Pyramimonas_sp.AAC.1
MKENERGPLKTPKWGQNRSKINDCCCKDEQRGQTPSPRRGQNPREGRRFLALPGVEKDSPGDPRPALSRPRGRG